MSATEYSIAVAALPEQTMLRRGRWQAQSCEHARQFPNLTLGVGAFSLPQKDAILGELELLRRSEGSDAEGFFNAHPHEPFFVKNLENVQGDERDVIFVSVGYGKDKSGYMAMSFGPLSIDGGERRLNGLITRARIRCEVFSSITAEDIDLERGRSKGVAAFKSYLHFAQTGNGATRNFKRKRIRLAFRRGSLPRSH